MNTVDVIDSDPLNPFATDTNTIHVDVHCETGCTLTQGYWKTHSTYGPASKPDATWNLLPGGLGPDTVFFLAATRGTRSGRLRRATSTTTSRTSTWRRG